MRKVVNRRAKVDLRTQTRAAHRTRVRQALRHRYAGAGPQPYRCRPIPARGIAAEVLRAVGGMGRRQTYLVDLVGVSSWRSTEISWHLPRQAASLGLGQAKQGAHRARWSTSGSDVQNGARRTPANNASAGRSRAWKRAAKPLDAQQTRGRARLCGHVSGRQLRRKPVVSCSRHAANGRVLNSFSVASWNGVPVTCCEMRRKYGFRQRIELRVIPFCVFPFDVIE